MDEPGAPGAPPRLARKRLPPRWMVAPHFHHVLAFLEEQAPFEAGERGNVVHPLPPRPSGESDDR